MDFCPDFQESSQSLYSNNAPRCFPCQIPPEHSPGCCSCSFCPFCACRPPIACPFGAYAARSILAPPYCRPSCIGTTPAPAIRCSRCYVNTPRPACS